MSGTLVFWLGVAVLLFWSLGAYNRLVRLRAQVITRFASVDQRLVQALALMNEAVSTLEDGAMAAVDDSEASTSGRLVRSGLQAAAVQLEVALQVAGKQPLDASAMAALQTAYATAHAVWERRRSTQTQEHDVTAAAVMQRAWEDNTQVVREAEASYNTAVQAYNSGITQFPASVLAYFFGFAPAAPL